MKRVFLVVFLVGIFHAALATRRESQPSQNRGQDAATLYARNCVSCHGRDGRANTAKAKRNHARNLIDPEWQARVSDERIFNSIMNGKGKMPAYSNKLSDQQIDALVSFVRSLMK